MTRLQPFFSTIELAMGNLNLNKIQKILIKELSGKSGIYGFISKTTDKLYIGSSGDLAKRLRHHLYGNRSNIKLQNAIKKYTLDDFIFVVFEYADDDNLLSREQFYLDYLKPE